MDQVSTRTSICSCCFVVTLIAGLLVPAVALVASDEEALMFELQSRSSDGLVKLEVMITPGSDFRVSSAVNGVKWTLYGAVGKVVDGAVTIHYGIKRDNSTAPTLGNRECKIGSLENFAWAGIWGGSEISRYWIRKGVDPVPVVNRILARRDKSFGVAASYLTELEPEAQRAALPQLIAALNDNSDRPSYDTIRANSAKTLGKFGVTAKAAVPALVRRLKDENGYIRVDSAVALWRIEQHTTAVPSLIAELKNEDRNIRSRAVSNLGDIADAENSSVVIPALISTFENDQHVNVRRHAAYALATSGVLAKSAVPTLSSALDDEHEEIRRAASHAIEVIFGRKTAQYE
jgi:hypothetical protein